ncbi:hypothetical protein COCVIDRAFT_94979 [Bipolaris victoriae FI3]|uniref:Uncharacterized protein n=1 Tax=Bipolaris victoriae (strain FI3) TaxID=930091 RepID=W7EKQ4_BIPV3|nr:hypothetical protein COCVIDRAFT_94979 [Bipolaris victoriae FI3]
MVPEFRCYIHLFFFSRYIGSTCPDLSHHPSHLETQASNTTYLGHPNATTHPFRNPTTIPGNPLYLPDRPIDPDNMADRAPLVGSSHASFAR